MFLKISMFLNDKGIKLAAWLSLGADSTWSKNHFHLMEELAILAIIHELISSLFWQYSRPTAAHAIPDRMTKEPTKARTKVVASLRAQIGSNRYGNLKIIASRTIERAIERGYCIAALANSRQAYYHFSSGSCHVAGSRILGSQN